MSDFLNDEETQVELDVLRPLPGGTPLTQDEIWQHLQESKKASRSLLSENRKILKKHERAVYGYQSVMGDRVPGLVDRIRELEAWKSKWEENEKRVRYALAGFAIVGPFLFTILGMIFKALLAKMGLKV